MYLVSLAPEVVEVPPVEAEVGVEVEVEVLRVVLP
jgi:hypothetical protein